VRGQLLARRGDFAAAHEQLDQARWTAPAANRDPAWTQRVELALWEGNHQAASAAIDEGLAWRAGQEPSRALSQYTSPLYALALRLAADRAERSRLEGAPDPERWHVAAAAWEMLNRPFEAAYARFRQAEALLAGGAARERAGAALRPAHHTAVTLHAAPLRREIELLAQRGRLHLQQPVEKAATPAASSPTASLGLTQREAEVLALIAEGRTNRRIGQALFITPKTASVHVSRILAKLGVSGRGEAAAVAHRLGLDQR
jgi:DNA-binding CsgD family transcriptional regulator